MLFHRHLTLPRWPLMPRYQPVMHPVILKQILVALLRLCIAFQRFFITL